MAAEQRRSTGKIAKILNSTSTSFFSGLGEDNQSSLFDVLADYFDDECIREDRGNNSITHDIGYIQDYCFFR